MIRTFLTAMLAVFAVLSTGCETRKSETEHPNSVVMAFGGEMTCFDRGQIVFRSDRVTGVNVVDQNGHPLWTFTDKGFTVTMNGVCILKTP